MNEEEMEEELEREQEEMEAEERANRGSSGGIILYIIQGFIGSSTRPLQCLV